MEKNKPILIPVKREDFKMNFGDNSSIGEINIEEYYRGTINHIQKMAAGPYFWFVFNTINGLVHAVGGMIEKVVPMDKDDFLNKVPEKLFAAVHPEDISKMFAFTNYWVNFFAALPDERKKMVRPTIYIRQLNPAGVYRWVMVQYLDSVYDTYGTIGYGLTLVTDISHIKKEGVAMMSVLDHYDDSCQIFFCTDGKALPDSNTILPKLTAREVEVVRFLATGFSSKQLASELNISIKTVDNHRQNLLRKTNTGNTGELVAYAINNGFI